LSQIARQIGAPSAASFTAFAVRCASRLDRAKRATRAPRSEANVADKYHLLITTTDHLDKADVGSRIAVIARETSERIVSYRIYYQR
jgi:hypothetical protein